MEEFKEKNDRLSQEKHEGDEHQDEKKVKNCPPYNHDFQLQYDAKPETVLIQQKDFKSGPENYSARTETSMRTKHTSNLKVVCESHHRITVEFSKEFSRKYDYAAPQLPAASSHQETSSADDVTSTNISSALTSKPTKIVLSVDVARRNKKRKLEKGKAPIVYEADDCRSSSNRREDGQENFECISSKAIVSTVKRARIYESEPDKSKCYNFSFNNWVASITNGLAIPHDGPTEASQHMKGIISLPISDDKRECIGFSHETRGFRSIFQAVCHSANNNTSSSKVKHIDHQKEIDALKGIEGEKASNDTSFSFGDGEKDIELHNKSLASKKRFSKEISPVDSCASQNSLWISRHSPGVFSPQPEHIQCSNCLDLSAQHKLTYLEAKKIRLSEKPQHNSISYTDSHCSKLDALKQAKPSKFSEKKRLEVNFNSTAKIKHENQFFTQSEGKKDHHQVFHGSTISQKQNKDIEIDMVVCEEVRSHKNESVEFGTIDLRSLPTTVMDETNGVFIAVRKLRLSRMDVLRWMKSRVSHHNLCGFFLRLRIEKQEKVFGGTRYHVARINGASCRNSVSVCVGTSTYSVTYPSISNHDFNEDELKAWWFQNLRDGAKMPSSEELNEKFQLKLRFGF